MLIADAAPVRVLIGWVRELVGDPPADLVFAKGADANGSRRRRGPRDAAAERRKTCSRLYVPSMAFIQPLAPRREGHSEVYFIPDCPVHDLRLAPHQQWRPAKPAKPFIPVW